MIRITIKEGIFIHGLLKIMKAIADFTKAIELDPEDPYNYQMGNAYVFNEQHKEINDI